MRTLYLLASVFRCLDGQARLSPSFINACLLGNGNDSNEMVSFRIHYRESSMLQPWSEMEKMFSWRLDLLLCFFHDTPVLHDDG